MGKKFVFYLKSGNRAITMTDHKEVRSLKDLQEVMSNMMASDKLIRFTTSTDCLVLRPTEIGGIHIQEILAGEKMDYSQPSSWAEILNVDEDLTDVVPDIPKKTKKPGDQEKSKNLPVIDLPESSDDEFQLEDAEESIDGETNIEQLLMDSFTENDQSVIETTSDTVSEISEEPIKSVKHTMVSAINVTDNLSVTQQPRNTETEIHREEITDPTLLFSHPNTINMIPKMGEQSLHIFQREDGSPVSKTKPSTVMGDIAKKAKASGMTIKAVPIRKS